MNTHSELKLYKGYLEYVKDTEKFKRFDMEGYVLESHKELADEYGFYIRVKVGLENVYEIWTETLREYKLWVDYLKNKD